jgi:hypothetical protein
MSERSAADLRKETPPKPKEAPPVSEPAKDASPAAEPPAQSAPAQSAPAKSAEPAQSSAAPKFRLRPVPILVVILLAVGLWQLSGLLIDFAADHIRLPAVHGSKLAYSYFQETVQFVLALIAIAIARRIVPADYGLHWPRGNSYVLPAIYWSVIIGLVMTLVDFAPQIITHTAPKFDDPLTRNNVLGWLFFQGVYSGPVEEVPYRALLVTYLSAVMPGKVHWRRYEMNGAGVVVAIILALPKFGYLITEPVLIALGQVLYTFAFGVLLAYWLEKSKSVLAPIIGHNVAFLVRWTLMFAMIAAWR